MLYIYHNIKDNTYETLTEDQAFTYFLNEYESPNAEQFIKEIYKKDKAASVPVADGYISQKLS